MKSGSNRSLRHVLRMIRPYFVLRGVMFAVWLLSLLRIMATPVLSLLNEKWIGALDVQTLKAAAAFVAAALVWRLLDALRARGYQFAQERDKYDVRSEVAGHVIGTILICRFLELPWLVIVILAGGLVVASWDEMTGRRRYCTEASL